MKEQQTEQATSANVNPWEKECQTLRQECERLSRELAELKKEKDWYERALKSRLPVKQFDYTKEELFACLDMKPTLWEIIEELKRDPAYDEQSRDAI